MTFQEINRLIAKDALVAQHKYMILSWNKLAWEISVEQTLTIFLELPRSEQAWIRGRYWK